MSILDKCFNFTDARKAMAMGFYPYFREITSEQDTEVICNGKKMLMMGSNSYLGLTTHPKVKEAGIKAMQKYGSGCAGSRFLNGTLDIHLELERELARLVGKEAALAYPTGYQANVGCIAAIVAKNEYIVTDKFDHASIIDGCKLSDGIMLRYNHNDMASLERVLQKIDGKAALIVVDGIFSMEGDIADLPAISALAEKYGANLMVDEAHSLGVLGDKGAGAAAHFGLTSKTDFIMGTFSKSLASVGGFIAADEPLIHYLKHKSRALIFSASLPPASTASVLAALQIMIEEPERIAKLWENTHYMMAEFKAMGYDTGTSCTPVIPLHVGDMMTAFHMWAQLGEEGVFINPVIPPAVPPNCCLIRTSFMATHTKAQLDLALEKFHKIGKKLGVI
ncbi:MAG: pyridoxal phosphate-dependent aminotransferase family protein [Candidatus Cloacimonetes bacterium]|jgi:8-amino-7-oxononanoate synthase|nr:pyridoxal phosphate-dependent aminotransferase family protein [Candidatus Cloacimonadota bacterium]MDD4805313.1 pyridoxal phosphate-dependent aminotransferase family protein [Candidatus Cloacimonadota bacterium]